MKGFVQTKDYRLDDLCGTFGEKMYIIGAQNGLFPNFGRHSINEMGGFWIHPFKVLDGLWNKIEIEEEETFLETSKSIEVTDIDTTFYYTINDIEIQRNQFIPLNKSCSIIKYTLKNTSSQSKSIKFYTYFRTEIMPAWASEKKGLVNNEDVAWEENGKVIAKDSVNSQFLCIMSDADWQILDCNCGEKLPNKKVGKGKDIKTLIEIDLSADEETELRFFVSGSSMNAQKAIITAYETRDSEKELIQQKQLEYDAIQNISRISTPDNKLDYIYNVTKVNNQWLKRDVEGIGKYLSAGLPDYPWVFGCDNFYSIFALLSYGQFDIVKSILKIIKNNSEQVNGNGRVIHEISTSGVVYNKGNTQETPHFIIAVWEYFKWTGDRALLAEMYDYCLKGMDWLMNEMDADGDLFPSGYGITEIRGLNAELIDTAVYTASAMECVSKMAEVFDQNDICEKYIQLHKKTVEQIEKYFWLEEQEIYADCVSTPAEIKRAYPSFMEVYKNVLPENWNHRQETLENIVDKIMQLPNDEQMGVSIFRNWVILTPLEQGLADTERAVKLLDKMSSREYLNDYGLYIDALCRRFAMTISTGVLAVSEAKYRRSEQAIKYIKMIGSTMGMEMPLSMSELSPTGGCFVQEWTAYGTMYTLVRYIFGINPAAYDKRVELNPCMPKDWDMAEIDNVKIGEITLSLKFERQNDKEIYKVEINRDDWDVVLEDENNNRQIIINGHGE